MVVFAFVMLNSVFVLVTFLLQINKDSIHVEWPYNAENIITYQEVDNEITIKRTYLELEPIGLMFIVSFGAILIIQFIAMLIHRFKTMSQILAATEIDWYCGKKAKEMSQGSELKENGVQIAFQLQRPKPQWDTEDMDDEQVAIGRRDTVHRMLYQHKNTQDQSNLENNFKRHFFGKQKLNVGRRLTLSNQTMHALERRRSEGRSTIQTHPGIASTAPALYSRPLPKTPDDESPNMARANPLKNNLSTAKWVENQNVTPSPPPNYATTLETYNGEVNYAFDSTGESDSIVSEMVEMQERPGPKRRSGRPT